MRSVVYEGELLGKRIPEIEPLFINLATASESALRSKVGMLGWVLWLNRQSNRAHGFQDVLRQVVQQIDSLPDEQSERWEQLLWYAHALVYHKRNPEEREQCAEYIRATVRQARKTEAGGMSKTIAEAIEETTRLAEKRETVLRLLRAKFKTVPAAVEAKIRATMDAQQLDSWQEAVVTTRKLNDIPFEDGI
jgi:hypothetical protein